MNKLTEWIEKFKGRPAKETFEVAGYMHIQLEVPIKEKQSILIVDDEVGPREALRMILKEKYNVFTASCAEEAIRKIADQEFDLISVDIRMPNINGLQLLNKIKLIKPQIEVLVITGFPSVENAVEALRFGAYDYIIKPFDMERVQQAIKKGILRRTHNLLAENIFEFFPKEEGVSDENK